MVNFNSRLPEWNNGGVEPPQSKKDAGWKVDERPPAAYMNWFQNTVAGAVKENREKITEQSEQIESNAAQLADTMNKTEGTISIKDFGGKVDGLTDDTQAFNAAVASMVKGQTLKIPKGNCLITNVVFNPPDDCKLECDGTFISSAQGVVFQVGDLNTLHSKYDIKSLKVKSVTRDWTAGRIGIKLVNLYASLIDITDVYGFEKNLVCEGINSKGFSYNEIRLGVLADGKKLTTLQASVDGWCNENMFYGGRYTFSSSIPDYTGCVALTEIYYDLHPLNNNRHMFPSFEAASTTAVSAIIESLYSLLFMPRIEGIGGVTYTTNSLHCTFQYGYGSAAPSAVTNNGQKNKLILPDRLIFTGGAVGSTVTSQNVNSSNDKVYSGLDAAGAEKFYVKGTGQVYSANSGYFNSGIRFNTSDATYNDRGIFTGSGSPEGFVTARTGSLYLNSTGGAGVTLYVKETGTGNTGWVAK